MVTVDITIVDSNFSQLATRSNQDGSTKRLGRTITMIGFGPDRRLHKTFTGYEASASEKFIQHKKSKEYGRVGYDGYLIGR